MGQMQAIKIREKRRISFIPQPIDVSRFPNSFLNLLKTYLLAINTKKKLKLKKKTNNHNKKKQQKEEKKEEKKKGRESKADKKEELKGNNIYKKKGKDLFFDLGGVFFRNCLLNEECLLVF
jgi:hypothetical protein